MLSLLVVAQAVLPMVMVETVAELLHLDIAQQVAVQVLVEIDTAVQ